MGTSWKKILLIVRREYQSRTRQRSFRITTALMAVALVLLACSPTIFQAIRNGRSTAPAAIAVADLTGTRSVQDDIAQLDQQLRADAIGSSPLPFEAVAVPLTPASSLGSALDMLHERVRDGKIGGLLTVDNLSTGGLSIAYETKSGARDTTEIRIQQAASTIIMQERLQRLGLNPTQQAQVLAPVMFTLHVPAEKPGQTATSDTEKITNRGLAYILDIVLYMSIIIYGMWVAGGVGEEKSNRIMEIMINAATPSQLMVGKIVGIGAAALTQYLCITIPAGIVFATQGRIAQAVLGERKGAASLDLTGLSVTAFGTFLVFFVLGFLMYAALYAAAGSMVSRQEEVQQIAAPMNMVMVGSFFGALSALGSPDGTLARVLAFVPFSAPLTMMTRIIAGNPAPWEVALSVAIMVASIALFIGVAARIYRIGVLLYGTRPSLRTIFSLNRARVAR